MSFSMIASVGFLLLVGLVINSVLDVLNSRLKEQFPVDAVYFVYLFNLLIDFAIITLLFTIIFKTLPIVNVLLPAVYFLVVFSKSCRISCSSPSMITTPKFGSNQNILLSLEYTYKFSLINPSKLTPS